MSFFDYYVDEMGMFNNMGSSYLTAEEEAYMESIKAIPCYGDPEDAIFEATIDSIDDFHKLTEALMIDEFTTYVSTNEEVIYEEGRISQIFGTIRKLIEKAWAKIKGAFIKFKDMIASKVGSDKKFVEKYSDKIKSAGSIDIKLPKGIKTFKDIDQGEIKDLIKAGDKIKGKIVNLIASPKEEATAEDIVKEALGGTVEEYLDSIKNKVLPDDTETKKLTADEVIAEISAAKGARAAVESAQKRMQNYFGFLLKENKRMESTAIKTDGRKDAKESGITKSVGIYKSACNTLIRCGNRVAGFQLKAISRLRAIYRSAATKMASGTSGEADAGSSDSTAATGESADMLSMFEASLM